MLTMVDAELHDGGSTSFTLVVLLVASNACSRRHGTFRRRVLRCANVRMACRETASLMLPISSRPDMNSRAVRRRSHRSRITDLAVSSPVASFPDEKDKGRDQPNDDEHPVLAFETQKGEMLDEKLHRPRSL